MKPLMILAMPSSGSDWLAKCMVDTYGLSYFQKEFFNPLTNQPMADDLIAARFGCELTSCHKLIHQRPDPVRAETLYRRFVSAGYGLGKEVWAMGKVDWFAERFRCLVLTRKFSSMFPPGRLRVHQWYESVACDHLRTDPNRLKFSDRVRYGHELMYSTLKSEAIDSDIPAVDYDELVDGAPHVRVGLETWIGSDPSALLSALRETGKRREKIS